MASDATTWEKVVRKLRGRMMPSAGVPRPDEATYDARFLSGDLSRSRRRRPSKPGPHRHLSRLNRTEYQNAIRDILALDVDVSALLPKDDASHGFDNVSNELSPTLIERYLAAAQKVSRAAVGSPLSSPASHVVVLPADLTQEDHLEGLPLGTRGGTIVRHTFPLAGTYEIQIRLSRDRNENVEGLTDPQDVELTLDGNRVQLFSVKPNRNQVRAYYADEAVDRHLKVRLSVAAGPHDVGVTFLRKTFALEETERQPALAHFNMDRHAASRRSRSRARSKAALRRTHRAENVCSCAVHLRAPRFGATRPRPAGGSASTPEENACATIVRTLARRAFRRGDQR